MGYWFSGSRIKTAFVIIVLSFAVLAFVGLFLHSALLFSILAWVYGALFVGVLIFSILNRFGSGNTEEDKTSETSAGYNLVPKSLILGT